MKGMELGVEGKEEGGKKRGLREARGIKKGIESED